MTRPDGQLLNPDAPGVLITGAAGEVGHAILRGLAAGGAHDVVATDLRSVAMDGASCVQGDLLDPNLVESLFTGRIGLVIHLAALLSSAGEQHPDLAFSGNGIKQLTQDQKELEHLRKQLKDVTMERDILKKAVSIFSKSDRKY